MTDNRKCGCGCGEILVKRKNETKSEFIIRKYMNTAHAAKARKGMSWGNQLHHVPVEKDKKWIHPLLDRYLTGKLV